jgi:hypothetical protein
MGAISIIDPAFTPRAFGAHFRRPRTLAERFTTWRYTGDRRDLRLDMLRGFAAFAMISDHLAFGARGWLGYLTGGDRFAISAAEAFVLISGIVMGITYRRTVLTSGINAATVKALKRAGLLYFVTITVSISFLYLSWVAKAPWGPDLPSTAMPNFLLQFATLKRTFYMVDIPLMYVLLILLAVPAIFLLRHGLGKVVLAVSIAAWAAWQHAPGSFDFPWKVTDNYLFFVPAWQIIFFAGLVGGWYRNEIEATLGRLPALLRISGAIGVTAAATGLYLVQVFSMSTLASNARVEHLFFDKADVTAGRLLALAIFGSFAFLVTTVVWRPVRWLFGWLLIPLGQASLQVYLLHVYVVLGVAKILEVALSARPAPALVTVDFQLASVLIIWLVVSLEPVFVQSSKRALPGEQTIAEPAVIRAARGASTFHPV